MGIFEVAVSLARYAERIGYCECSFFGVNNPACTQWECRNVWTKAQRDMVAWALREAEDMLQNEVGYPLSPHWFANERHVYECPVLLRWGKVIEAGAMVKTAIELGATVDHTADPATITVLGATCDPADVHVYHPGTDIEIEPESVEYTGSAGDVLTITIPWCRMVAPAYAANPENGWSYADVATWISHTVDVYCISSDPCEQAHIITKPGCSCFSAPCTDGRHDACVYLRMPELGSVEAHRADCAAGVWTHKTLCYPPRWLEVSYKAGMTALTAGAEDAIIRLAHSLMSEEPCGCDVTQRLWRRDREVPTVLTRERINCPFGVSAGAWFAWRWAQSNKLVRGSVL